MSLSEKIEYFENKKESDYSKANGIIVSNKCIKITDVKTAVLKLKKLVCKCKDVSKEEESAYKRIQIEFNKVCPHHKINEIFGKELTE